MSMFVNMVITACAYQRQVFWLVSVKGSRVLQRHAWTWPYHACAPCTHMQMQCTICCILALPYWVALPLHTYNMVSDSQLKYAALNMQPNEEYEHGRPIF